MRLNVGKKLLLGFLSILILLSGVTVVGIVGLKEVTEKYDDLLDRVQNAQFEMRTIELSMSDQARSVLGYMLTADKAYRDEFNQAAKDQEAALSEVALAIQSEEGKELLQRVREKRNAYQSQAALILDQESFAPEETQQYMNIIPALRREAIDSIEDLSALGDKIAEQSRQYADRVVAQVRLVMISAASLAVAVGLLLSLILGRQIAAPVVAIRNMAARMAEGDLTVEPLSVKNRDELGEMAAAFNQMLTSMRSMLERVSVSTNGIMRASEQLSSAAESSADAAGGSAQAIAQVASGASEQANATAQASATMAQLKDAIQQIAAGAANSAAQVQDASGLLNEMVEHLNQMAADASGTAEQAEQAVGSAEAGARVLNRALQEIAHITEASVHTAERIEQLERFSGRISAITEVISNIAAQTNLLSLNAAIEAARAGEHGRGFAVVAEEVRKLAEQSAASTREITDLVHQIQVSTAEAVKAVKESTERANLGNQMAAEAGDALSNILVVLNQTAVRVDGIARAAAEVKQDSERVLLTFNDVAALTEENMAATEEMAAGANEVIDVVAHITDVAQSNAAAAEEVSASVEELTAAAEEVSASAQSLAATAHELQAQVQLFKL